MSLPSHLPDPSNISTARELAAIFGSLKRLGVIDRAIYSNILRATLEAHAEFWGVWSVWEPNALDGRDRDYVNHKGHDPTGRYVELWHRGEEGIKQEPNLGYEIPGIGDYYLIPWQKQQEVTFDPYEYRPLDGKPRIIMSQVAPIIYQGACVGVAGFDVLSEKPPIQLGERLRYSGSIREKAEHVLSSREQEVLSWVSEGKSNAEIGMILGISAHTVKHHMEKIFAKLGVENRHAAMLWALRPQLREGAAQMATRSPSG